VANKTQLGLAAKGYMDKGELVPDAVVIGLVKNRLQEPDASKGFILDGFPRTVIQAQELDRALDELGRKLDAVVSIAVDKAALTARLTARRTCKGCSAITNVIADPRAARGICPACEGELYQRDDDTVETVTNRLDVYERSTAPLVDYYRQKGLLREVDGDRAPDSVFQLIETALKA
jgi:adenylate kinase